MPMIYFTNDILVQVQDGPAVLVKLKFDCICIYEDLMLTCNMLCEAKSHREASKEFFFEME